MSTQKGIPTPLTALALDSFTASHQATPTQTIRSYLGDQKSRQYPIEQLPPRSAVPPAPRLPSSPRKDTRRAYEYGWGEAGLSGTTRDSALQLIRQPPKQAEVPSSDQPAEPAKKRPSLVSQMKPRMSKPGTPVERPGTAGSNRPPLRAFRDMGNTPARSSSPVIKSRREAHPLKETPILRTKHAARSPSPPPSPPSRRRKRDDQSNKENIRPTSPPKKRQRASTTTRKDPTSTRKRAKLAAGAETESSSVDPYDELAARLEARRLRRREKAAIVKDKTKAVVASAAEEGSRLRAKNKAKRRKDQADKGEQLSASSEEPRRKRRRDRSSARQQAERLREIYPRPKTINKGRLTLPPPRIGLFGNAVSSKRTKVAKGQAAPDLPAKDVSFLNRPESDSLSYDTAYSTSYDYSTNDSEVELEPEPDPTPPRKHHRSRDAFAQPVGKYKYDPNHNFPERTRKRRASPSPPPVRLTRHGRPASRSRHRHRDPSPPREYRPIERPPHPRPPSPRYQPVKVKPPSNSTSQSKFAAGRGSKITPSEHSAYSLQHLHTYNPPQRRSFDQPFVQVSPTPPQSGNPSAILSGASLARLSAQRAISGVVMDTTRTAWHGATVRPTPQPQLRSAPAQVPSRRVQPPSLASQPTQQPRRIGPTSLASFELAPAEALSPTRSAQSATRGGPAFLSQVPRLPSRPPSRPPIRAHFQAPEPTHSRHVSFGNEVEYISPPRTMITSAGRSRVTGPAGPNQVDTSDWTAPWSVQGEPLPSAQPVVAVDEFGYTQLRDDVLTAAAEDEQPRWLQRGPTGAGVALADASPLQVSEDTDLVLPWQLDGVAHGVGDVGGASTRDYDWHEGYGSSGAPAAAYVPPSRFDTSPLVPGKIEPEVPVASASNSAVFVGAEDGVTSGELLRAEDDGFAREMRGWWHRSRP